jgi:hypothetical protein
MVNLQVSVENYDIQNLSLSSKLLSVYLTFASHDVEFIILINLESRPGSNIYPSNNSW